MFIWNNMLFVNAFGMFWVLIWDMRRGVLRKFHDNVLMWAALNGQELRRTSLCTSSRYCLLREEMYFSDLPRVPITNAFGSNDTRHCVRIVEMESFCHVTPLEANAQISRSALSASPMNYGHLNDRPSIPSRCITSLWNFHFMLLNIKLQM